MWLTASDEGLTYQLESLSRSAAVWVEFYSNASIRSGDQLECGSLIHFKRLVVILCDGWRRHTPTCSSWITLSKKFGGVGPEMLNVSLQEV